MARILGIVTKPTDDKFNVIMHNAKRDTSIETLDTQNEDGEVDLTVALRKTKTISVDGDVNGAVTIEAGDKITYETKEWLVKTSGLTEVSGGVQTFAITMERKDEAVIVAYGAEMPAGA